MELAIGESQMCFGREIFEVTLASTQVTDTREEPGMLQARAMPVGPKWRQGAGAPLAAIGRKQALDKSVGKDMTPATGIRFLEIISCRYRRQPQVCQSWGCPPAAPYPLTPGAPFQGSRETPSAGGRVTQEGAAFLMLDLRTSWAGCTISAHGEPGPTEEGPVTGQPCRAPLAPLPGPSPLQAQITLLPVLVLLQGEGSRTRSGNILCIGSFGSQMSQPCHCFQDFSKQIKAPRQPSCLSLSLPPSRPEPRQVCGRHAPGVLLLSWSLSPGGGGQGVARLPGCGDGRGGKWALWPSRCGLGLHHSELRCLRVTWRWKHGFSHGRPERSGEQRGLCVLWMGWPEWPER